MQPGYDTVTIIRPAATDRRGAPTGPPISETVVEGCSLQPGSSSEDTDQRTTVTTGWRLFAPGGTDIQATDRVQHGDTEYEVVGDPDAWVVDGEAHHVQAELRQVRG